MKDAGLGGDVKEPNASYKDHSISGKEQSGADKRSRRLERSRGDDAGDDRANDDQRRNHHW